MAKRDRESQRGRRVKKIRKKRGKQKEGRDTEKGQVRWKWERQND